MPAAAWAPNSALMNPIGFRFVMRLAGLHCYPHSMQGCWSSRVSLVRGCHDNGFAAHVGKPQGCVTRHRRHYMHALIDSSKFRRSRFLDHCHQIMCHCRSKSTAFFFFPCSSSLQGQHNHEERCTCFSDTNPFSNFATAGFPSVSA